MTWKYSIPEEGMTVIELLKNEWGLGKKIVHELRMARGVLLEDGSEPRWQEPLAKGTVLVITTPDAQSPYRPNASIEPDILFEDEHFIIANKPKGLATHPNDNHQDDTFVNGLIAYVQKSGGTYLEHIHRLDQGTSGLLLVAKHPIAKNVMDRMVEQKLVQREYEALVKGLVRGQSGTLDFPLGRDRHHATRRRVSPNGQNAVTHYRVIERADGRSLLHLTLETGRTHQIRAHLSHTKHPIIGDELYGGPPTENGEYFLHAFRIAFIHPFTGQQVDIEAKQ
ncbi:RluA family pseudouridine synthase [Planococcus dechangensis]|uniref:Pseudouridine synthase n=1 Tax=Planococcus dechangensis TaxID=1176255 RepID=A0ABV9MDU6_9BACL